MPAPIDDLLARRLVILSGKGGVGKSVVGAALALAAVERGKRVLLVEIDAPLEAARYLGAPPVGSRETEIRPGLFAVNLDPDGIMDEYVRHVVRIEFLARRILESPIYHRFFTAAPGLRELMLLGKILVIEEARDGWSRRPRYDLVLVDAPATGHGLSFLKVPIAARAAAPIGPIGTNARRILNLLRDARRTALVIVTVPEEMAVVEAAWFHRLAVEEVGVKPRLLVLNAAQERRFTEAQEAEVLRLAAAGAEGRLARGVALGAALDAARRQLRRRKLTRFYQTRLKRSLPLPLVTLPYLYDDPIGPDSLRVLADRLAEG
jgi:anion-transporting  ArsA/GET3 family ATPase